VNGIRYTTNKTPVLDRQEHIVRFFRACVKYQCQIVKFESNPNEQILCYVLVPEESLEKWRSEITVPKKGRRPATKRTSRMCPYDLEKNHGQEETTS